jgi:hypothetical protein
MRFHEQLKKPSTPEHDRACVAVMKMPLPDVLEGFFPKWDRSLLNFVELEWLPEEPVREPHRGNLVGFVDLLARATWTSNEKGYDALFGIEVKTPGESMGNSLRQVKAYRGGLVCCSHLPMSYGQVIQSEIRSFQLDAVALAIPQGEITDDVRLLATGVPLISVPEFEAVKDPFGFEA